MRQCTGTRALYVARIMSLRAFVRTTASLPSTRPNPAFAHTAYDAILLVPTCGGQPKSLWQIETHDVSSTSADPRQSGAAQGAESRYSRYKARLRTSASCTISLGTPKSFCEDLIAALSVLEGRKAWSPLECRRTSRFWLAPASLLARTKVGCDDLIRRTAHTTEHVRKECVLAVRFSVPGLAAHRSGASWLASAGARGALTVSPARRHRAAHHLVEGPAHRCRWMKSSGTQGLTTPKARQHDTGD